MFKVEDKTTGEIYTVFATNGTRFLVYNEALEWWFYKDMNECRPVEEIKDGRQKSANKC